MANADAWNAGFSMGKKKDDKQNIAKPNSFKKGGKVRKTGFAKVHKGEVVLTAKEVKRAKKSGRKKVATKR